MRSLILTAAVIFFGCTSFAQNKKITELTSLPNVDIQTLDVIPIVDVSEGPTGITKKVLISELDLRWITYIFDSATSNVGMTFDNEAYVEFQEATGNGDNYIRLQAPNALGGDYSYTLPVDYGTNGYVLTTDGIGGLTWVVQAGGAAVSSVFTRSGAVVAVAGDYTASQVTNTPSGSIAAITTQAAINELDSEKVALSGDEMTGNLSLDNESELQWQEATANGNNYISFKAPASLSGTIDYTLPDNIGTPGYVLSTNGLGALDWIAGGGGGGANIQLSNLGTTAVNDNINPDANNTHFLGIDNARWGLNSFLINAKDDDLVGAPIQILDGNALQRMFIRIGVNASISPTGVAIRNAISTVNINSGELAIFTVNDATVDANATDDLQILTGNKEAGTGGGGNILIRLGTGFGGGARGKLSIVDGTEGTDGDVWTQNGTGGAGNWETPVTGGALSPTGTVGAPITIDPTVGIIPSGSQREMIFLQSTSGTQAVTANPQIAAGSIVGEELILVGTSGTEILTLANGTGLALNGVVSLNLEQTIYLVWDGGKWQEISRR